MTKQNKNFKVQLLFSLLQKISWFIKKTDIVLLITLPQLVMLVFVASSVYVYDILFSAKIPGSLLATIGAIAVFISGLSGLAQIIRQEAPGVMEMPVRGTWAVFTGWMWLALCWVSCLLLAYLAFTGM